MNEARRMQYLEAMGVDMYVPRYVLPHAAAMRQCALPTAQEQAIRSGALSGGASGGISTDLNSPHANASVENSAVLSKVELRELNDGLNSVLAMLDDVPPASEARPKSDANLNHQPLSGSNRSAVNKATPNPAQKSNESSVELISKGVEYLDTDNGESKVSSNTAKPSATRQFDSPDKTIKGVNQGLKDTANSEHKSRSIDQIIGGLTSTAEAAHFNLNLWFLNESSVQVVDSRQPSDALPTEALLRNIAVAAGLLSQALPRAETQVWPFPGAVRGDQSWSAASAMMADFFNYRFEQAPARAFVVLGEAAAKAVLGADIVYSSRCFSADVSERYQIPVLVLPSLRDLLYQPQLKAKLWSSLVQLRAALMAESKHA